MNYAPDDDDNLPEGDFIQFITEYVGRRRRLLPPQFPENELVAGPYPLDVNLLGAGYVPAFPNLAAVVVAANGERHPSTGGYIRLPSGRYKIYYVDLQERYTVLPEVRATTLDGASVTITCGITYAVNDAMAIQNVRNPLDALFRACEAALRQVVRTNNHDQVIGEPDDPDVLPNQRISEDVQLQVSNNQACRAFSLHNVNIIERQGDPRLLNIREARIVQRRTGENEIENTRMRTRIAEERRELTVQQGAIIEVQANSESQARQIRLTAEKLAVEIERLRRLPQFSHDEIMKELETRGEALKSLIQAQAMPGFPRNADDLHLVDKIVSEMPNIADQDSAAQMENANQLNSTLIELLIPKKKG